MSSGLEILLAHNILINFPVVILQVNEYQGTKRPVNSLCITLISAFSSVSEAGKLWSPESSTDCYGLQDSKLLVFIYFEAQVFHRNSFLREASTGCLQGTK